MVSSFVVDVTCILRSAYLNIGINLELNFDIRGCRATGFAC